MRYLRTVALSRDGVGLGRTWSVHAGDLHWPSFSHQPLRQASWRLGQWCHLAELDLAQAFEAALVAFSIAVGSGYLGLGLARRIVIAFALIILTGCILCVLNATGSWSLLLLLLLLLSAAIRALAVPSYPLARLTKLVAHTVRAKLWKTVNNYCGS